MCAGLAVVHVVSALVPNFLQEKMCRILTSVLICLLFQKSCCALRAILWIEAQKKPKRDLEVTVLIGKIHDNNNSFLYSKQLWQKFLKLKNS